MEARYKDKLANLQRELAQSNQIEGDRVDGLKAKVHELEDENFDLNSKVRHLNDLLFQQEDVARNLNRDLDDAKR